MSPWEQGGELLAGGRFHEALAHFGKWVAREPSSVEARMGLAQACAAMGDPWTAVAWFADACRVGPDVAAPAHELAALLLARKQYAQALPVYERLYRQFGARDRVTLLHYGFSLEQTGAIDDAARIYREALALEPDFMEAHVDLAGLLWRLEDHAGALAHARQAVALAPDHPYAVRIEGTALLHNNRVEEAEAPLRRALALDPKLNIAAVDLALALLLGGKLREGWQVYHQRWADTERMVRPAFYNPALEWQGPQRQPARGLRVLVYAEQGLGDVINFIRYVRLLQADGATVSAVVQPELVDLVESMPGVTCFRRGGNDVLADVHVALLDLPMHYGTTLENIPAGVPYLSPPAAKVAQWRDKVKPWDGKRKIGIAWAGSPVQVNNRNRSTPLSALLPLLNDPGVPDVQFFSLQKSDGGGYTDTTVDPATLLDFTGDWQDFTDSAAMLQCLDLVITVDSAVTHLAGALGKPVWTMLGPNCDWRWLLNRDDSPWYPTMRLFRRNFGEDRAAQVSRVREALQAWVDERLL